MAAIVDDFDRADADGLGTASGGFSWTEVAGDIDIASNEAAGGAGGVNTARAESDLGSTNHYAEVDCTTTGDGGGPCIQFAAAANTCYAWLTDGSGRVYTIIAGSLNNITTLGSPSAVNDVKLQINSGVLEGFVGGVSQGTHANSDITGNTRAGIWAINTSVRLDNFSAEAVGGGGGDTAAYLIGGDLLHGRRLLGGGLVQ